MHTDIIAYNRKEPRNRHYKITLILKSYLIIAIKINKKLNFIAKYLKKQ